MQGKVDYKKVMASQFLPILVVQLFLLPDVDPSDVRYFACMADKSVATKMLELEKTTVRHEKEWKPMAEKRGMLQNLMGDYSGMTVHVCTQRCWFKQYTIAGLQEGQRCYCGSSTHRLVKVDASLCYSRCSGNCRQRCGGRVALSVYETGYDRGPHLPRTNLDDAVRGCRTEDDDRTICDDHTPHLHSLYMSAAICINYCYSKRNRIAAFRDATTCCCGRTFPFGWDKEGMHQPPERYCTWPCADKQSKPLCIGKRSGKHLTQVFDVTDDKIWPEDYEPPDFDKITGWLAPVFPSDNNFELEEYRPIHMSPKQRLTAVHVEEDNEEERSDWQINWTVISLVIGCVVLVLIFIATTWHKRNRSPNVIKLPYHLQQKQEKELGQFWGMGKEDGAQAKKKSPWPKSAHCRKEPRTGHWADSPKRTGSTKSRDRSKYRKQGADINRSQNRIDRAGPWEDSDSTDMDSSHTSLLWNVL